MSEARFTPRPWKYVTRDADEIQTTFAGVVIGSHMIDIGDIKYSPNKSDAHLIASAPDLYEALDNLIRDIGGGHKDCGHDFTCTCAHDKAHAALSKARGES